MSQRHSLSFILVVLLASASPLPSADRHDDLGVRVRHSSAGEQRWASLVPRRRSAPGRKRADGESLTVVQTDYSHTLHGNVALLIWEPGSMLATTLRILVDGSDVGEVENPRSAPISLVFLDSLDVGAHDFRVEETGVEDPVHAVGSLEILPEQPFSDSTDIACGASTGEGDGTCVLRASWTVSAAPPSFQLVLLDDDGPEQVVDGTDSEARFPHTLPGQHEITVIGFLEAADGVREAMYRGGIVSVSCDIACNDGPLFRRGDCNSDGHLNITDAVFHLNRLFSDAAAPRCEEACDANGDALTNISDPLFVLGFLFGGTAPPPPAPGPNVCGADPDPDTSLGCEDPSC